jgi:hypothetical protein
MHVRLEDCTGKEAVALQRVVAARFSGSQPSRGVQNQERRHLARRTFAHRYFYVSMHAVRAGARTKLGMRASAEMPKSALFVRRPFIENKSARGHGMCECGGIPARVQQVGSAVGTRI